MRRWWIFVQIKYLKMFFKLIFLITTKYKGKKISRKQTQRMHGDNINKSFLDVNEIS